MENGCFGMTIEKDSGYPNIGHRQAGMTIIMLFRKKLKEPGTY